MAGTRATPGSACSTGWSPASSTLRRPVGCAPRSGPPGRSRPARSRAPRAGRAGRGSAPSAVAPPVARRGRLGGGHPSDPRQREDAEQQAEHRPHAHSVRAQEARGGAELTEAEHRAEIAAAALLDAQPRRACGVHVLHVVQFVAARMIRPAHRAGKVSPTILTALRLLPRQRPTRRAALVRRDADQRSCRRLPHGRRAVSPRDVHDGGASLLAGRPTAARRSLDERDPQCGGRGVRVRPATTLPRCLTHRRTPGRWGLRRSWL